MSLRPLQMTRATGREQLRLMLIKAANALTDLERGERGKKKTLRRKVAARSHRINT